ncbi:amino acid ABC transporter substrate-binding protein [Maritalea porphyrae]|uniref:Amino acid ABC transporter substrate-binding protein n=1 Tax=Maritalea porphyrae TaxID=880732 RepID=A0ABQ5UPP1_9HYPH|nr:amino acid ABC transporter substrate-binding protein [Maritalea porphyrae]GLQ17235.1 amino acid ABC transporter substrate-binding protein [Maritalea porphyrae]
MRRSFQLLALLAYIVMSVSAAQAGTLETIKERGTLNCGVNTGLAGFAQQDSRGNWSGFDVDFCRAVSAAIFGDGDAVRFVALTAKQRFEALQSGEIDLLSRNTTWTFSRDTKLHLSFAGTSYYDGQGFLIPKRTKIETALDLNGARICVQVGTTTELNLSDYFQANKIRYIPVRFEDATSAEVLYATGECDVYTADASALAATRAKLDNPEDHTILPEIISKEPLGPVVNQGDENWVDLVRWTLNALIAAEELGITSQNVETLAATTTHRDIGRLLGTQDGLGSHLGVEVDWVVSVVKAVGNYEEIFDRNIGLDTPIGLTRGLNAQWQKGGLLYAPPFR